MVEALAGLWVAFLIGVSLATVYAVVLAGFVICALPLVLTCWWVIRRMRRARRDGECA